MPVLPLFEKLTWPQLDGFRQLDHGRHLGVTFPSLYTADLRCMDPAPFGNLLLGETQPCAGGLQIGAKVAHARDRQPWRVQTP